MSKNKINKIAEEHAYFTGQEKFREELIEWAKFVLKCQEENLAECDGPSYMKASIMGRIDAYKVLIAKLNSFYGKEGKIQHALPGED